MLFATVIHQFLAGWRSYEMQHHGDACQLPQRGGGSTNPFFAGLNASMNMDEAKLFTDVELSLDRADGFMAHGTVDAVWF